MKLDLTTLPLPALVEIPARPRRRHRVGGLDLDNGALRHFQRIAGCLDQGTPPPDADAMASAARSLIHQFAGTHRAPPCIRLRLRCLHALRAMSAEPAWRLDGDKQQRIALLTTYAANRDRLVPDAVPVIGGLDEAVLVDLAWPSLRFELGDYLDFRRLRAEEASLQGRRPHAIVYSREQWLQSRYAELAWRAHTRRCGRESYLGAPAPPLFRVH